MVSIDSIGQNWEKMIYEQLELKNCSKTGLIREWLKFPLLVAPIVEALDVIVQSELQREQCQVMLKWAQDMNNTLDWGTKWFPQADFSSHWKKM